MITRRGLLRAGVAGLALGLGWPEGLSPAVASTGSSLVCDLSGRRLRQATPAASRPAPFSTVLPRAATLRGPRVDLEVVAADVEVLPGLSTSMLTYGGTFPGPTIVAVQGQETVVEVHDGVGEGAVLHLHGAHVAAEHDGHVAHLIPPGGSRAYRYANDQRAAMLWYHDHLLMRTAERVYRGLAGGYLLLDPGERDLGLPVDDERDIALVLTDKSFAADGALVYDGSTAAPMVGDVVLVNGADRPRVEVGAGSVRLRVLNGSNARAYRLVRADGRPLVQIGTDGGLLSSPVERDALELWPAERVELLLDLTGAEVGERVVLADAAGAGDLLAIDVAAGAAAASAGPLDLPQMPDLGSPEVVRRITLDQAPDGRFLVAGHGYDPAVRDVHARLGAVERWQLVNTTTASHPMHLHLVTFLVRSRRTSSGTELALRPEDEGWKDTVLVRPFETVEVDALFADHVGDFMYHCHVLEHEDHDMMSQFRVVDLARVAGRTRVETAAAIAARLDGPRGTVVVADGEDWRGALAGAALADALLLSSGPSLDPLVEAELRRLPPAEVVVVGTAVPDAVVQALSAVAPTRRVAGGDDVTTAAMVATDLAGRADTAVLATSAVFADALAAGLLGVPVLLTDPAVLSAPAAAALQDLGVREVLLAGGTAAVGEGVERALVDLGFAVTRVAGADRTETAAAFARMAGLSSTVWAASASRFPDALGAAVAARRMGATLVLVGDTGASPATAALMAEAGTRQVRIAGGEAAVPLEAEDDLAHRITLP